MKLDEFKNLMCADDPKRTTERRFFGNFGISAAMQKMQLDRELQVGDNIYFLKIDNPIIKEGIPTINAVIIQEAITEE